MSGADWVIFLTLVMSVVCFVLYVVQSLGLFSPKPVEPAKAMVEKARGLSPANVPEMTELLKAAAALADSLGRIGPTLTSLIGAILFATIAALATHALPGTDLKAAPTPKASPTPAPTKTAKPPTPVENAQQ
jgi:hypothetical protein